jgi:putative (di)nucleoside polyphosphate hydrolase
VVSASVLDRTPDWITYDFPPEVLARPNTPGFKGQRQVWFAMRFEGDESEIDVRGAPPVEFDAWRWTDIDAALDLVVPFKRSTYRQVIAAFRRFAAPL